MIYFKNMKKFILCICLLILLLSVPLFGINETDLADICEAMENAIVDISVEYESYVDPPPTLEDIAGRNAGISKGPQKCTWSTKRPFEERSLYTTYTTIMNQYEDSFDSASMESYNGKFAKYVTTTLGGNSLGRNKPMIDISRGVVTESKRLIPPPNVTPIAFSILRPIYTDDGVSLSEKLRKSDFIHLHDIIEKINGFKAQKVDFLIDEPNIPAAHKQPYMSVYFSIDNDYVPIKYMYYSPSVTKPRLEFSVDVQSLKQCSNGLWFPSMGSMKSEKKGLTTIYKATKVAVNQGLKDEDFTIDFPPGTKVFDEVIGITYTVRPSEDQMNLLLEHPDKWVESKELEEASLKVDETTSITPDRSVKIESNSVTNIDDLTSNSVSSNLAQTSQSERALHLQPYLMIGMLVTFVVLVIVIGRCFLKRYLK